MRPLVSPRDSLNYAHRHGGNRRAAVTRFEVGDRAWWSEDLECTLAEVYRPEVIEDRFHPEDGTDYEQYDRRCVANGLKPRPIDHPYYGDQLNEMFAGAWIKGRKRVKM